MHPFELRGTGAARLELAANPNLHGLHIVLGARLDGLDGSDVGSLGVSRERLEPSARGRRQRCKTGRGGTSSEREQPGAFHAHPLAHQPCLAEQAADRREFGGIAAVERRESLGGGNGGGT